MQGSATPMDDTNGIPVTVEQLKSLDETDRAMLGLYYYEELSVGEIATIMEMETGQVEDVLQNAMARLDEEDTSETRNVNSTSSYTSL